MTDNGRKDIDPIQDLSFSAELELKGILGDSRPKPSRPAAASIDPLPEDRVAPPIVHQVGRVDDAMASQSDLLERLRRTEPSIVPSPIQSPVAGPREPSDFTRMLDRAGMASAPAESRTGNGALKDSFGSVQGGASFESDPWSGTGAIPGHAADSSVFAGTSHSSTDAENPWADTALSSRSGKKEAKAEPVSAPQFDPSAARYSAPVIEQVGTINGGGGFSGRPEQAGVDLHREIAGVSSAIPGGNDFVSGGAGLTKLIDRLAIASGSASFGANDVPAPVATNPAPSSSGFSDIYKMNDGPAQQSFEPVSTPARSPVSSPSPFVPQPPARVAEPIGPYEPPAAQASGSGGLTQILNMSKSREEQLRAGVEPSAASQAVAPVAQPYQPPAPPQGFGAMPGLPQGFGAPPAIPQWQQPQYASPPLPQPPQVQFQPSAPAVPQVERPALPTGGLQAYVPLLLIVLIFLSLVNLITMVLLLKH